MFGAAPLAELVAANQVTLSNALFQPPLPLAVALWSSALLLVASRHPERTYNAQRGTASLLLFLTALVSAYATSRCTQIAWWLWLVAASTAAMGCIVTLVGWTRSQGASDRSGHLVLLLMASGTISTSAALLSMHAPLDWQQPDALAALTHLVATPILLGITFFCALQLTFFSSPQDFADANPQHISWTAINQVATLFILFDFAACSFVLLGEPPGDEAELRWALVTRMLAITLLVLEFITWSITRRLASFQKHCAASGWTSLALASWIACLALVVVCIVQPAVAEISRS